MTYTRLLVLLVLSLAVSCSSPNMKKEAASSDSVPASNVPPIDRSLALQPPMGWNSWDCLGWDANEKEVRAAAEYMAKNLKRLGYEYIVIDQMWYGDAAASNYEDFVHERIPVKPHYTLDEYGRLQPDVVKYPSSVGGEGFKPLADYIHSLGLKFGLHLIRGIPWSAAEADINIKGTSAKTGTIAQPDKGCDWYDGFYGVDMTKPGAQEYYNSVFEEFAEWGVDFVKVDDLVNIPEFVAISRASRTCGRPIVFSAVPAGIPYDILRENSHMARTGADFWDVWQMLKVGFPVAAKAVTEARPGFWPDLDMLPIGKIGIKISYKGPDARISNLNNEELHTLLSLWYISKMPLMIGGYLPETDKRTFDLITNEEALAVNRTCINPRQIKFKNAIIIWAADIPDSDDKYLALFNTWESKEPIDIKIAFDKLGLQPGTEYRVRDLWAKKDLGKFSNEFSYPIKAHGAGLYRISKI